MGGETHHPLAPSPPSSASYSWIHGDQNPTDNPALLLIHLRGLSQLLAHCLEDTGNQLLTQEWAGVN